MSDPAPSNLRTRSEALAAPLPDLQARAERLARTLLLGGHGRKQAGTGDEFWQYRPAQLGDSAASIDWRRSGQSDTQFVREKEWQAAQSVHLWVDRSAAMQFASITDLKPKADRAGVLAMALSILLMKGGERVALAALGTPPRIGALQLSRIADGLISGDDADYGAPDATGFLPHSAAVFMSDFLGPLAPVEAAIATSVDLGIKGILFQILDPAEEAFPYQGRTIFTSMGGAVSHETLRAGDLRDRYRDRLNERKHHLSDLAKHAGWQFETHHTDAAAQSALLWLYAALEGRR
ncbi:MAG: DUF58 domain-containing protein [Celeribacter marinus]